MIPSSRVLVLCYHAVSESWPADLSTTPGRLRAQLELLVGRGYRGATFSQAVEGRPSGPTVVVTFDDAYRSVLELALPILADLGLPGTVFVPTAFPDLVRPMAWPGVDHWLGGPHEDELRPLRWSELATLGEAGWEVGSHTRTHPRLPELDDAALADELEGSRRDCEERLGAPCRSLAYPYGAVDARVVEAAGVAGYGSAATLPARLHAAEPLHWPRVGIYHGDDLRRFKIKVSPAVRRLRASAAWSLADRLRRAGASTPGSAVDAHPGDARAPDPG